MNPTLLSITIPNNDPYKSSREITTPSSLDNCVTIKDAKEHLMPKKDSNSQEKQVTCEFNRSAEEILLSIISDKKIEGIDLAEAMQNPDFRFKSTIDPELSASISEAFAVLLKKVRLTTGRIGAAKANKKRIKKADEYAVRMYEVINNIKQETGVSTFRATVEQLTQRGIDTPNGGKWSTNTLQDLQKRWRNLGLVVSTAKPK
ncbi:recombinase family protein [Spirosoma sp. RP8]|uniref:Recombinase family protein n=1 Tax=Spirosoma liriopis TaxID=2937440 RepID=A0ABT0HHZ4_9BACT|nr:recombinase family protein [Spirosoma liriopis]MCK8491778.1 recombinase family protein [Spirosoma liriopis]